jgi:RHH-type transcriptional regulator, proline utilization regulon repressor / proline dehydrogenase / delta 1-pyrroline-5-carboxylate dehydrogenase
MLHDISTGRGIYDSSGISVKLSALHPRYERAQLHRVLDELFPKLKELCLLAQHYQIGLFIDAEEVARLNLSLILLEKLMLDKDLRDFAGIGFVIQAYQQKSLATVSYVIALATKYRKQMMVRLVKGAYWDTEIKFAQVHGYEQYSVFTSKHYTDVAYLACAQALLAVPELIYAAFATHNAHTVATIMQLAHKHKTTNFEFQCLYGMGESLYKHVIDDLKVLCRIYAPVGQHHTLLPYLVRRLLENGANSSFVNQLADTTVDIAQLTANPLELAQQQLANYQENAYFASPLNIYSDRKSAIGIDLADEVQLSTLERELNQYQTHYYIAHSLLTQDTTTIQTNTTVVKVLNPANHHIVIGEVRAADIGLVSVAIIAASADIQWAQLLPRIRANIIKDFSHALATNYAELIYLLVSEAGKTINNAIAEVREAIDFCNYYAAQVSVEFDNATHKPLGTVVCISPWNFPLAIFVGEIVAALLAGNNVIAKPASQTSLIAFYTVQLLHAAGVPRVALQLLVGSGGTIGDALTQHSQINAVIFTGSSAVASRINQNLLNSQAILIAETGGQNAMIVDSSALVEQVVVDIMASGFDSAGQRCSALRVVYLQNDIADKTIELLKGAMDELIIGDPASLSTDIGPVINQQAQEGILKHITDLSVTAIAVYQTPHSAVGAGNFVAPTLLEISHIAEIPQEIFGPVVHIIRFAAANLKQVIADINNTGFGLTAGVHSRLQLTQQLVFDNITAGNIYVNRNMIGATVGSQPFGGNNLSGTGPKAGGPFYLYRLVNTASQPTLTYRSYPTKRISHAIVEHFIQSLDTLTLNTVQIQALQLLYTQLMQHNLLNQEVVLEGVTGEDNLLRFKPKGNILCLATSKLVYCTQLLYVLATGNIPYLILDEHNRGLSNIATILTEFADLQNIHIHAVLADDIADLTTARHYFAYSAYPTNMIVPFIRPITTDACNATFTITDTNNTNTISFQQQQLLNELAISINTTASGGNAELFNLAVAGVFASSLQ